MGFPCWHPTKNAMSAHDVFLAWPCPWVPCHGFPHVNMGGVSAWSEDRAASAVSTRGVPAWRGVGVRALGADTTHWGHANTGRERKKERLNVYRAHARRKPTTPRDPTAVPGGGAARLTGVTPGAAWRGHAGARPAPIPVESRTAAAFARPSGGLGPLRRPEVRSVRTPNPARTGCTVGK